MSMSQIVANASILCYDSGNFEKKEVIVMSTAKISKQSILTPKKGRMWI